MCVHAGLRPLGISRDFRRGIYVVWSFFSTLTSMVGEIKQAAPQSERNLLYRYLVVYSLTRIPRIEWGNRMCLNMPCFNIEKINKTNLST